MSAQPYPDCVCAWKSPNPACPWHGNGTINVADGHALASGPVHASNDAPIPSSHFGRAGAGIEAAAAQVVIDRLKSEVSSLTSRLDAATRERDELITALKTMEHKVITCGVAARHPDATLTTRGAYADEWDSPQAESVRELRRAKDAATRRAEEVEALLREARPYLIAHTLPINATSLEIQEELKKADIAARIEAAKEGR